MEEICPLGPVVSVSMLGLMRRANDSEGADVGCSWGRHVDERME